MVVDETSSEPETGGILVVADATPGVLEVPKNSEIDLSREIWESYRDAYYSRYKTEPVRNATVNAQIKNLGKRLGKESVDVVRFFVGHNSQFYLAKCHPIGLCLSDAEALRTQWARGQTVFPTLARQAEISTSNHDVVEAAFRRLSERKKQEQEKNGEKK